GPGDTAIGNPTRNPRASALAITVSHAQHCTSASKEKPGLVGPPLLHLSLVSYSGPCRYRFFGETGAVDEPLLVAVLVKAGVVPPEAPSPCTANIASFRLAGGVPAEAMATTGTGVPMLNDVEM